VNAERALAELFCDRAANTANPADLRSAEDALVGSQAVRVGCRRVGAKWEHSLSRRDGVGAQNGTRTRE